MDKVQEFYDTDQLKDADPVPGSLDALNRLREMGYPLAIVTARLIAGELESTLIWVDKHFNSKLL
jgi:phosphoglycolate phosphatase-like HAD superfamily hydrolase